MNNVKLTFLGGAGTVTGSKTLVETSTEKVLVDCGLFQGLKEYRLLNRAPLPVEPKSIETLILTHAHLDHCGYIPLLVKNGFQGKIHCTHATLELTEIILRDSAKIQEEDAARANRHSYSKHQKAEPLYTQMDVIKAMKLFVPHDYNEWVIISPNLKFELLNSGHILGSSFVNMKAENKKIIFSGDIGRTKPMILYPPTKLKEADYIILESTYGDRLHDSDANVKDELLDIIVETYKKRGILMIPSFAVERTQEILYLIYLLRKEGKLPTVPIYLDSPMGINATKVYYKHKQLQNIPHDEIKEMYNEIYLIKDAEMSKEVCLNDGVKIVIAGSGMIEGGRIIHYLYNHMDNEKNTLLFVGYQGVGTRGRSIIEGNREIKFFGEYHKVNCDIRSISSLSAHGDQTDMLEWLKHFKVKPKKVILNHGEPHQSDAFRTKIAHELKITCEVAKMNQTIILD